ncbi:MAG TPA: type II secretion system F family protein [bacterium]|nr:type II secretion system F family protein [bacterium]
MGIFFKFFGILFAGLAIGRVVFLFYKLLTDKKPGRGNKYNSGIYYQLGTLLIGKLVKEKEIAQLRELIRLSGRDISVEYILGKRVVLALILFCAWMFMTKKLFFGIILGIGGYMLPYLDLKLMVQKRRDAIFLQLPDVLDMLTILVESGMDFAMAIDRIIKRFQRGVMIEELDKFQQDLLLGKSRIESLRALSRRNDSPDLSEVCTNLIQSQIMGSELGETLRRQAEIMRNRRFMRAEEKAQASTVKIIFPIVFFIMPALFILVFGPAILQLAQLM